MEFEKNIYQKQHQLLMDTRLRAEEQYKEECYQANTMLHGDLEQL